MKIDGVRAAISYGYEQARNSDLVHQVEDFRYRPPLMSGGAIVLLVAAVVAVGVASTWGAYRAGANSVRSEFAGRVEALQGRATANDFDNAKRILAEIARLRRLTFAEETTSTARDVELARMFDRIHTAAASPKSPGAVAVCGTPPSIVKALNSK